MKFYLNIYKSELLHKENLSKFSQLIEETDYFFKQEDEYFKIMIDLDKLVRGNIIDDFYKEINNLNFNQNTVFIFQKLNLNNDESLLRLITKIGLHNEIVSDFCNTMIQFYKNLNDNKYFYVIEFKSEVSTLHRFSNNNEDYKIDSYDTIDNQIDEIEVYNYSNKKSQKISVLNKNEITIFENKFIIKKVFFKDKKIERLSKLSNLIDASVYYKGFNHIIDIDNAPY